MQAMGVVVTGPGAFDPALLPPMPPDPTAVNLDVTTLCALVSEVSNGDPRRPELQQWAQRVVHWQVGCKTQADQHALDAVDVMPSLEGLHIAVCQLKYLLVSERHIIADWYSREHSVVVFCFQSAW